MSGAHTGSGVLCVWKKIIRVFAAAILTSFLYCITTGSFYGLKNTPITQIKPFFSSGAEIAEIEPIKIGSGEVLRYEISLPRGEAKAWIFPDGSVFWCENSTETFTVDIGGFSEGNGVHLNAEDIRSPYLLQTESCAILVQPPLAREPAEPDGMNYVAVDKENGTISRDGDILRVEFDGECADWWAYIAPERIEQEGSLKWLEECTVSKFGNDNRMTLDGYYYTTPSDYTPSGDNCFYRIPAAYIPSKLARWGNAHHGYQIAAAMLDIQMENYNDLGYIPTYPESAWLKRDYKIDGGFYDTRFNTDVAHSLLALGREMDAPVFTERAMLYADFLVGHAEKHSFETESGILVDDYSHRKGGLQTHTSLNHQLAEILFLFECEREDTVQVAELMLKGVEDTAESWVKEDGNLHYARYPDGSFGGQDYPYLTYSDLVMLNEYLGGNEFLEYLIASKRIWLDANGFAEYGR